MQVGDLSQVCFSIPDVAAEAVSNLLVERVGSGIEQRDTQTLDGPGDDARVELVVWIPKHDVAAHVAAVEQLVGALKEMEIGDGSLSWNEADADPDAWVEAYKAHFKLNRVGEQLIVKPSWVEYEPEDRDLLIELDPGMAFGTGLHPSTRMVMIAMERLSRQGVSPRRILDLGCGTGILAISAARLWATRHILAIDNDELAVTSCKSNAERNQVAHRIQADQRAATQMTGRFDLILANLSSSVLSELLPLFPRHLERRGRIILSGLLSEQAKELTQHFASELAYESEFSCEEDGWRAVQLRYRA